jgi:glyoxylase-like metal-dependent hydrolase (beta-lactamase superfamily II)
VNQLLSPVGSLQVEALPLGPFETNAWLLTPHEGGVTVVDPGMEAEDLLELLDERGRSVERILLTHGHLDHVAGCSLLVRRFGCPVHVHPADLFLVRSLVDQGAWYGYQLEEPPAVLEALHDGQRLALGAGDVHVLHTPGHSPGGVCFLFQTEEGPQLVCGDTLFAGSYGRTDLPGGSLRALRRSIQERIFPMPDATRILPGHGSASTVASERRSNPINWCDEETDE